ncbi:MAG: LOG family protein [Candidatus Dojkabacteria bacterium]
MSKHQIGIIGFGAPDSEVPKGKVNYEVYDLAYELGSEIGKLDWIVVTGGGSGVMEAANRGCQEAGGISVGVTPENKRRSKGNQHLCVEVVSGMNMIGESTLIVTMCDALILLGGGSGSLQEVAIAYRQKKPIYSIEGLVG